MRDPIDQTKLDTILSKSGTDDIFAVKHEGPDWEEFEKFVFTQYSTANDTAKRLEEIKRMGYKIFIVPSEGLLYDEISKTVHKFDRNGRGEIVRKWE